MKLGYRFRQLAILFDAERLAREIGALPAEGWRAHPKQYAGNDALTLVTTDGDPASDDRGGAMGPTPHLLACPYLMQVLGEIGATLGRTRLMRLAPHAQVRPHVDTDYYWRDHIRVHIPILTQPTVRFLCGGEETHMAPGECWIFDTWSLHSVHNEATVARVHLVVDTVGGPGLQTLIEEGRSPREARPGWAPRRAPPNGGPPPRLAYESRNIPAVMTPWELRDHLGFLLKEIAPGHPRAAPVGQVFNRLHVGWRALWAQSGDDHAGLPAYRALMARTWAELERLDVDRIPLANRMPLGRCLLAMVFQPALGGGGGAAMDGARRAAPAAPGVGAVPDRSFP
jgi:hypothetical protein